MFFLFPRFKSVFRLKHLILYCIFLPEYGITSIFIVVHVSQHTLVLQNMSKKLVILFSYFSFSSASLFKILNPSQTLSSLSRPFFYLSYNVHWICSSFAWYSSHINQALKTTEKIIIVSYKWQLQLSNTKKKHHWNESVSDVSVVMVSGVWAYRTIIGLVQGCFPYKCPRTLFWLYEPFKNFVGFEW